MLLILAAISPSEPTENLFRVQPAWWRIKTLLIGTRRRADTTHVQLHRWSSIAVVALGLSLVACNPAHVARQAKNDVDSGNAAACAMERSNIQKAVETYTLLNPDTPITETAMVEGGYLHQVSVLMDITSNGTVVPAAGSVCV